MPVHRVGKSGYKYGSKGKTYYGKGAKKKAQRQAKAINISKKKRKR